MNEFFLTRRKKALQHFFWFVIYIYIISIYTYCFQKLQSYIRKFIVHHYTNCSHWSSSFDHTHNRAMIPQSIILSINQWDTTQHIRVRVSIQYIGIYIFQRYIYHQIEAQLTALGFAHLNTRYMIDREVRCLLMCVSAFSESESETERDDDPWSWDNQTVKNMRY